MPVLVACKQHVIYVRDVTERCRYPYMVSLRSPNGTGGTEANPTHFCGGVLISAGVVLTGINFQGLGFRI